MDKSWGRRLLCVMTALFGILFLTLELRAADIAGSSAGIFTNPVPPDAIVSGVGTNFFTWGDPADFGTGPSSLTFNGVPFTANFEEVIPLGTLTYFNGLIAEGTGATAVDLDVTIRLIMPSGITEEFIQTLRLINTPNTGTPEENADIVFLPTSFPEITFVINGIEYALAIFGFESITGQGFTATVDRFNVLEGGTASAQLLLDPQVFSG